MKESQKNDIILLGDVHNNFSSLNEFILKYNPNNIIILGDFGYFPNLVCKDTIKEGVKYIGIKSIKSIKPANTKIYWLDGNHEDHLSLEKYQNGKIHELEKNIFYCSRGSVLKINNYKILFIGGAASIDKDQRTIYNDWFPQETISNSDLMKINVNEKIDIICSHTCPDFILEKINKNNKKSFYDIKDVSCLALREIFNCFKPQLWFFGHFHTYLEDYYNNCKFIGLNHIKSMNYGPYFYKLKL